MHNLKIWRTVVVAGAMLGVPACGSHDKKPATTPPTNTAAPENATPAPAPTPTEQAKPADSANATPPPADPCAGAATPTPPADDPPPSQDPPKKKRPRGGGDRPTGRGFVLA